MSRLSTDSAGYRNVPYYVAAPPLAHRSGKAMSMMHFEPFRSLRDLDRLSTQLVSGTRVPLAMPMDVWREGQTYRVALDLPGVDPEQIDLRVERSTLTVTASRTAVFGSQRQTQSESASSEPAGSQSGEAGADEVLVAERPMGSFSRQLVLGEGLDTSAVEADYRDGVLLITVPLAQSASPRRIQVGQGRGESGGHSVVEGSVGPQGAGDSSS